MRFRWLRVLLPLCTALVFAVVVIMLSRNVLSTVPEKLAMTDTTEFHQPPRLIGEIPLSEDDAALQPYALALTDTSLLVSSIGSSDLLVLDDAFERERVITLQTPAQSLIGGLCVDANTVYVADFGAGELGLYDWQGKRIDHYSFLPEQRGRMRPYNLALHDGILYVTDPSNHAIRIITAHDRGAISERGELLISVDLGASGAAQLQFASSALVTPDGRLLVSDMTGAGVHAYTCNGRYAYPFAAPETHPLRAPHMMAMDNLPNPEYVARDRKIFDPSGVLCEGRIHVIDREAKDVVVYDALGKPVLRYGAGDLEIPNGIAIDHRRRAIIIADSQKGSLVIYKY